MIPLNRLVAAIAAIATLQLGLMRVVSAQNNSQNNSQNDSSWCFDSRFDNLNATASYSVPGFKYPGDNSESTWTVSTGVVAYGGNTSRRLWINTSPAIDVDSDSLPYHGCIIEVLDLVAKPGKENDGDCTSSLGKECVAALLKQANALTKTLTTLADQNSPFNRLVNGSNINPSLAQCGSLVTVLPTECGGRGGSNSISVGKCEESPIRLLLSCILSKLINLFLTRSDFCSRQHWPSSFRLGQRHPRQRRRFPSVRSLSGPGDNRHRSDLSLVSGERHIRSSPLECHHQIQNVRSMARSGLTGPDPGMVQKRQRELE